MEVMGWNPTATPTGCKRQFGLRSGTADRASSDFPGFDRFSGIFGEIHQETAQK
jgi:hypothetical protein